MKNGSKKSTKVDEGKKRLLGQKLDTRTSEEIKREQEILLWMGDIRDEFILEAEDYKQYQKDKRIPSYLIVGGTFAAVASICIAIFFQTGHNRLWKDNDPMQLPYQTQETEWESETSETTSEEISEETSTEEDTTEESIEGASQSIDETNTVNVVNGIAASADGGWLAQSQNYRILAQTDENTVSVYYAWDGSLQCTFSGKLASGQKGCLAKVGDRIAIINGQTVALQMYVVGEKQLSQEMYVYWNKLSDTVFTSSDSTLFSPGKLYTINGVLLTEEDQTFVRVGDHIYSEDDIYDLNGQLLGGHQEFTALQEFGNYVLGCDYTTWTYVMFDLTTMTTVWTSSDKDWTYQYSTEQSMNWTMADGQGIVTDLMRNPKLTEADWIAQNADWALNGSQMSVLYENEQTKESIVRLIEIDPATDLRSYRYYMCNEQYQIQEELPKNLIIDYFADGVQVPLVWSLTDEGMLVFTNIWTKEELVSIPIDLNGGEIESIQITGSDPIYGITVTTMNPNDMLTFLVSNGSVISQAKNNTVINETVTSLDENTIVVYENGTTPNVRYFDKNGNPLSENSTQVVYADQYAVCTVQDGKLTINPRGDAAYQLPIASNEYLAITTGNDRSGELRDTQVIVLNSSGEEVLHLNGYGLIGNDESTSKAMLVDENTPLIVYKDESAKSGDMGLYSLKNQSWIVELSNQKLTVLSDNVYAKQSVGTENVSDLYRVDGNCIEEAAEGATRQGNYIVSGKAVYDLNGQILFAFKENEQFLSVINMDILLVQSLADGSYQTRLVDEQGETVWLEETGLTWTAAEDSWNRYTSWLDGNQKGVLLRRTDDNQLQTVLTEDEFLAKNASVQGTGMRLLSVTANFDGKIEFFLQTSSDENEDSKYVYHCDSDFTVIDSYSYDEYLEIVDYATADSLLETDDTVLFANDDMSCIQEENRIVIKDRAGQVRKEIIIR